jgi:hypothetical protein
MNVLLNVLPLLPCHPCYAPLMGIICIQKTAVKYCATIKKHTKKSLLLPDKQGHKKIFFIVYQYYFATPVTNMSNANSGLMRPVFILRSRSHN